MSLRFQSKSRWYVRVPLWIAHVTIDIHLFDIPKNIIFFSLIGLVISPVGIYYGMMFSLGLDEDFSCSGWWSWGSWCQLWVILVHRGLHMRSLSSIWKHRVLVYNLTNFKSIELSFFNFYLKRTTDKKVQKRKSKKYLHIM